MKKAFAALLVAVVVLAASSAWANGITQFGYSTDGITWTFQTVAVPTNGYVGVTMPDGSIFYLFSPGYNGPRPISGGLCYCSVGSSETGNGACKCANHCSINGVQGVCNKSYP
jgi:hypothetical protein